MRPYSILSTVILSIVMLMATTVFAQQAVTRQGFCGYGCGPYIPMVTTPEFSFQQVSPNPVGASNATAGLVAGATNSTLSETQGTTSSESSTGVWYQGGAPLVGPEVRLAPESIGRERHKMHDGMMHHEGMMHEEMMREEITHEGMEKHMRSGRGEKEEERFEWGFFGGGFENSASESMGQSKGQSTAGKKASRTITNDDVNRENEKNGDVKYNGKTEKI